jgi:hypothetical protein
MTPPEVIGTTVLDLTDPARQVDIYRGIDAIAE